MEYFEALVSKRAAIEKVDSKEENAISSNSMTARERIKYLLDEGSFVEIGALTAGSGSGVITGYGTINNRLVYLYSQDFAVGGALLNKRNSEKTLNIMKMALKMGSPLIQIVDSLGGDINEGMKLIAAYGQILNLQSRMSGVIPQLALICGPCTGSSALTACISDIAIMTKTAELYINSAEKVERQNRTYSNYDKYATACTGVRNGSVQIIAEDDKAAIDRIKQILLYLPQNNCDIPGFDGTTVEEAIDNEIDKLYVSGKVTYKDILGTIADENSVLELDNGFAYSIKTCLIKLRGMTVGVVATESSLSEVIRIKDCEKAVNFIKMCNAFNISILSLVDCKGFSASEEEEINGLSLYAAKLVCALSEANVPKVALITGSSIGTAHIVLGSKETSFDISYALPSAVICAAEPEEVVRAMYREEITLSENPKLKEKELLDEFLLQQASPIKAAEEGYIDDVIKPSEARIMLIKSFDMLQSKREIKYPRKYGSGLL